MAPKTWNTGQEVLYAPITYLCLPLAKPNWKEGLGAHSTHSARQVQGDKPLMEAVGRPACWSCMYSTVCSHTRSGTGHISQLERGLSLILNGQGLQTLFLIPQPLAS